MMRSTFVVAELSANHNNSIETAKQSIQAIKECGADAVKMQTYTADTITIDCDNEYFRINQGTIWDGRTLYDLYREASAPWKWQKELKELAESLGLVWFSAPFDRTAVDFLEEIGNPIYKIASFEITDIPLIEYVASKRKPIILSTGIATREDIEEALETCRRSGNNNVTLLKCTSSYPTPIEEVNLLTIPDMAKTFGVKVGISDHTPGSTVPIAAVALGAEMVEKHFIIDRSIGGPDSSFSMEPEEFSRMVSQIRDVEKALGKASFELSEKVKKSRDFSRSLFVVKDVQTGESITEQNVRSIRPGFGMHPRHYPELIGKIAARNLHRGKPLEWEDVQ